MDTIVSALKARGVYGAEVDIELKALWAHGVLRVTDEATRNAVVSFLENVAPWTFYVNRASSTSRHHPTWQVRKAGILRNTVECCLAVDRQIQVYQQFTDDKANVLPEPRDIVLAATILSDTFKYGLAEITEASRDSKLDRNHGKIAAERWRDVAQSNAVAPEPLESIYDAIYWHLGRFTDGWAADKMSVYSTITHQIDMFFSDKSLELLYDPKPIIAV